MPSNHHFQIIINNQHQQNPPCLTSHLNQDGTLSDSNGTNNVETEIVAGERRDTELNQPEGSGWITGVVEVNLAKDIKATRLSIVLQGFEETSFTYGYPKGSSQAGARRKLIPDQDRPLVLWDKTSSPNPLTPKQLHSFPFSFRLSNSLPASLALKYGSIHYELSATLERNTGKKSNQSPIFELQVDLGSLGKWLKRHDDLVVSKKVDVRKRVEVADLSGLPLYSELDSPPPPPPPQIDSEPASGASVDVNNQIIKKGLKQNSKEAKTTDGKNGTEDALDGVDAGSDGVDGGVDGADVWCEVVAPRWIVCANRSQTFTSQQLSTEIPFTVRLVKDPTAPTAQDKQVAIEEVSFGLKQTISYKGYAAITYPTGAGQTVFSMTELEKSYLIAPKPFKMSDSLKKDQTSSPSSSSTTTTGTLINSINFTIPCTDFLKPPTTTDAIAKKKEKEKDTGAVFYSHLDTTEFIKVGHVLK
ncbi:hypothetical protein HK102_007390, partial [Quaeritorhiza haematococci]